MGLSATTSMGEVMWASHRSAVDTIVAYQEERGVAGSRREAARRSAVSVRRHCANRSAMLQQLPAAQGPITVRGKPEVKCQSQRPAEHSVGGHPPDAKICRPGALIVDVSSFCVKEGSFASS
jgi:hypothetical protein